MSHESLPSRSGRGGRRFLCTRGLSDTRLSPSALPGRPLKLNWTRRRATKSPLAGVLKSVYTGDLRSPGLYAIAGSQGGSVRILSPGGRRPQAGADPLRRFGRDYGSRSMAFVASSTSWAFVPSRILSVMRTCSGVFTWSIATSGM